MAAKKTEKSVFWFDDGKRPNVADALEREKDIIVHRLAFSGPQADNWGAMSASQVYCITSARHEVPDQYKCNAALIARCPDLLAVSTTGAGYDTVDVGACTAAGVLLVNQAGANADAVAEHAVAMMLSLTKNIPQTDRSLRAVRGVDREVFKGWNARGRTVGLIGIGQVGSRVARICGKGLEMNVLACDPYLTAEEVESRGATKVDLATLLAESRFLSIHCPLNDETRGMIGQRELNALAAGSYVITTARGGIIDEDALAAALDSGHVAGAGIDVWVVEPPPLTHPLLKFDNLIATYHTAGVTHDSRRNMAEWNAEQVAAILRGERPPRLINPAAWTLYAQRFERIFGFRPGK
ncbi:MAG: hydroxyacid dehydrogenase [Betaproteobacteria bacterium]|nr:MAG: hydroxyacid dehydrogenase [Betaproteobacteria bacterium]